MKKSILLGMPKLTASPEMKKVALEDEPEKVRTYSGYTRIRRKYKCYMNCMVQNGILKAALYLPDYLRLDGDNCEGTRNIEVGTRNIKLTTLDKGRQRLILARRKRDK